MARKCIKGRMLVAVYATKCQFRLKIPHCTGRKFPTPELHEWASLASDGVEPSAAFWRVLGVTESAAKERAAASAPSCPRGGTTPALRRSFNRELSPRMLMVVALLLSRRRCLVARMKVLSTPSPYSLQGMSEKIHFQSL